MPRLVLWRPHVVRQALTTAGSGFLIALLISLVADFWHTGDGRFSWDGLIIFCFFWLMMSLLSLVVVVALGDLQRPGFLRREAHVIELTPQGVRLFDPIRGHSAEQANGSLYVFRTNVHGRRGALHGGVALRSVSDTLVIHPSRHLGAWSGLPVEPSAQGPLAVDPRFFDAILRCAA